MQVCSKEISESFMNPKKRNLKVFLVRNEPLQKNTAPYNRDLAIEKMVRSSFECEIVSPKFIGKKSKNRIINGLMIRMGLIFEIVRSLRKIVGENDCVIFLRSIDPFIALLTWSLCKPKRLKLAIERNEFPYVFFDRNKNFKKFLFKRFILPWHYKLFDVLFVITDELIEFYGQYAKKDCIIQKLPMTVDFSRFEKILPHQGLPYIFYAGSLSDKKDGVVRLIRAFEKISHISPEICLKIAGGSTDGKQEKKLLDIIKKTHLQDRIDLLGFIDRDDIPQYLCSAKIVVLPRPDSLQARGGFPTKLGEYLASGVPVIATRVGEIPQYLSEDEIFFISPDHIEEELTEKIEYILSNYQLAQKIAFNGKIAAKKFFSLEANQHHLSYTFNALFNQ